MKRNGQDEVLGRSFVSHRGVEGNVREPDVDSEKLVIEQLQKEREEFRELNDGTLAINQDMDFSDSEKELSFQISPLKLAFPILRVACTFAGIITYTIEVIQPDGKVTAESTGSRDSAVLALHDRQKEISEWFEPIQASFRQRGFYSFHVEGLRFSKKLFGVSLSEKEMIYELSLDGKIVNRVVVLESTIETLKDQFPEGRFIADRCDLIVRVSTISLPESAHQLLAIYDAVISHIRTMSA